MHCARLNGGPFTRPPLNSSEANGRKLGESREKIGRFRAVSTDTPGHERFQLSPHLRQQSAISVAAF
jgi:hypothetical protein